MRVATLVRSVKRSNTVIPSNENHGGSKKKGGSILQLSLCQGNSPNNVCTKLVHVQKLGKKPSKVISISLDLLTIFDYAARFGTVPKHAGALLPLVISTDHSRRYYVVYQSYWFWPPATEQHRTGRLNTHDFAFDLGG